MPESVMNWWAHQDSARARTARLVIMMIAAVFATMLLFYAVLVALRLGWWTIEFVFSAIGAVFSSDNEPPTNDPVVWWWWRGGFVFASGFVLLVVGACGIYEYVCLTRGADRLLARLGGRRIDEVPATDAEKQLVNIVHEMAIASTAPVPAVYVLDDEAGINALSVGFDPSTAAIAVTRGALDVLGRDQLQCVVAHELAHILNGDTRLNMIAIALVYGLTGIFMIGVNFIVPDEGDGSVLIGAPIAIIGALGAVSGKLIQVRLCRQREYLADACAVQYTRHGPALAAALRAIESHEHRSHVRHAASRELAHLFFADRAKRRWFGLFHTHPKPAQRIARIEGAAA